MVVLAAGEGRRLGGRKPLVKLHGRPLAWYPLSILHLAGAAEAIVVARPGLEAELERVAASVYGSSAVEVVVNTEAWRENGYSLLLALERLGCGEALVSMADHVYHPAIPFRLLDAAPAWAAYTVSCDLEPCCIDTGEATLVQATPPLLHRSSKHLPRWRCVDAGVHLAQRPRSVGEAAATAASRDGRLGLSGLVTSLAHLGEAAVAEFRGLPWLEVDTPRDLWEAERGTGRSVVLEVLSWLRG